MPSTPPKQSKFLEALRAAGGPAGAPAAAKKDDVGRELPPTPATLKRKVHHRDVAPGAGAAGEAGFKRARIFGGADGAEHRGLR